MAIQLIGSMTSTANSSSVTISVPTGYQAGDLLLLFIETPNAAISTPSGWTQLSSSPQGQGTEDTAGAVRLTVFYKIATSSESSITLSGGDHRVVGMACFRGVDNDAPIEATAGKTATATTSLSSSGLTTQTDGACVITAFATDYDGNSSMFFSSWSNSSLDSITEILDYCSSKNTGGGLGIAYGLDATAGTVNATTATGSSSKAYCAIDIALKPEPQTYNFSGTVSISQSSSVSAAGKKGAKGSVSFAESFGASFNGTSDYLTVPDSDDWAFGTDDYTIEFLVAAPTLGALRVLLAQYSGTGRYIYNFYRSGSDLYLGHHLYDASNVKIYDEYAVIPDIADNKKHHVAFVRSGTTMRMFVDGTQYGGDITYNVSIPNAPSALNIGCYTSGTYHYEGRMMGVRVTRGTARYSATFTPPTSFDKDSSNVKLCLKFEEAVGATSFTDECGRTVTRYGVTIKDLTTVVTGEAALADNDKEGTVSIAQSSTVTAAGKKAASGSASISQSSTVTDAGKKGGKGDVSISQSSTVADTGKKGGKGDASISQSSTVTVTGVKYISYHRSGTVEISQSSTVTAAGKKGTEGPASISQSSTITAAGKKASSGSASISQSSTVTDTGKKGGKGAASINQSSTVTITGVKEISGEFDKTGTISISQSSSVIAAGRKAAQGEIQISTTGQIAAAGSKAAQAAVSIISSSAVTAAGKKAASVQVDIAVTSEIAAAGSKAAAGTVSISQSGEIAVTGIARMKIYIEDPTVGGSLTEYPVTIDFDEIAGPEIEMIEYTINTTYTEYRPELSSEAGSVTTEVIGMPFIGATVRLNAIFPTDAGALTEVKCIITDDDRTIIETLDGADIEAGSEAGQYWAYYTVPATGVGDLSFAWSALAGGELILLARKGMGRIWQE